MADDLTIREARDLAKKLFGDQMNLFEQQGLIYVGRFLDAARGPDGRERAPQYREQEIFGVGKTFAEAFRFYLGAGKLYSYAGAPTSSSAARGLKPEIDKYGRIRGWTAPSGIFSKRFPGM